MFADLFLKNIIRTYYISTCIYYSKVFAIEARNGELLWKYDPGVNPMVGIKACCGTVNRGAALYKGLVYVGALDGRLIALDAATGQPKWEVQTKSIRPKGER